VRPEELCHWKISKTIGNRTRDLPACSVVSQRTAPPRAPIKLHTVYNLLWLLGEIFRNLWTPPYSFLWDNVQGRENVVGVRTRLRGGHPNLSSIPGRGKKASIPVLGPTHPLQEQGGRGVESNPSSAEDKNLRRCASAPLYAFMACAGQVYCLSPSRMLHSLLIPTYFDLINLSVFIERVRTTGLLFVRLPLWSFLMEPNTLLRPFFP
jgi:hypothetical protein